MLHFNIYRDLILNVKFVGDLWQLRPHFQNTKKLICLKIRYSAHWKAFPHACLLYSLFRIYFFQESQKLQMLYLWQIFFWKIRFEKAFIFPYTRWRGMHPHLFLVSYQQRAYISDLWSYIREILLINVIFAIKPFSQKRSSLLIPWNIK